jgi:hypothetical protein
LPARSGKDRAADVAAGSAHGDGAAVSDQLAARFDGDRALRHVVELVDRGGRHHGAPDREQAVRALEADLVAVADRVERQPHRARETSTGIELDLVNLIARLKPDTKRRVLLATHWDTRPRADRDADPARRSLPVPGANDGSSGVAVLVELLRVLRSEPAAFPDLGVDVALFDGEELVVPGEPPCCPGSRHFAESLATTYVGGPPLAAIVLDMIGDRELTLRREAFSDLRARWLVDLVWTAGRRRAPAVFLDSIQPTVLDDQGPLLAAGVPAVLMTDLEYAAWHTMDDLPERLSAQSLATVGVVLLDVLAELARREPGAAAS